MAGLKTRLPTDPNGVYAVLDQLRAGKELPFPVLFETYPPLIAADVVESIVALGNSETGGIVFFGVIGSPYLTERGLPLGDGFERLVDEACWSVAPKAAAVRSHRRGELGAVVVESEVERSGYCFDSSKGLKRGVFKVANGSARHVSGADLERFLDRAGLSDVELGRCGYADLENLDGKALERAGLAQAGRAALKDLGVLSSYGRPTLAGAVAFGSAPLVDRYPALGIRVREYRGGADESEARGLRPTRSRMAPGGAAQAIPELAGKLVGWLPIDGVTNDGRQLFTELLTNAVGHRSLVLRDLRDLGLAVDVHVYSDQIRISTSGGAPRGRVRQLGPDRLSGRLSRNPKLMTLLVQLGWAREQGLGLARVRELAPRLGCRIEVGTTDDRFEVRVIVDPEETVRVNRRNSAAPPRMRLRPEERRERLLRALGEREMSARELSTALGWPLPTVRLYVRQLVEDRSIHRTEASKKSPGQRYRTA